MKSEDKLTMMIFLMLMAFMMVVVVEQSENGVRVDRIEKR